MTLALDVGTASYVKNKRFYLNRASEKHRELEHWQTFLIPLSEIRARILNAWIYEIFRGKPPVIEAQETIVGFLVI